MNQELKQFELKKVWNTTAEILQIFPLSLSTLNRFSAELIRVGRSPTEMGRYNFKGVRSDCWDAVQLKSYMIKEQLKKKPVYDHEKLEQDKIKSALVVSINNNNNKLIGESYE